MEKNIYKIGKELFITSDEEIKEGDWFMSDFNSFPLHNIKELSEREGTLGWKQKDLKNNLKIILTTDQDLIKDGVQEIDNEFLEWFVKNPSCEKVEVAKTNKLIDNYADKDEDKWEVKYHIYFPKEEPKQETLEEAAKAFAKTQVVRGKNLPEWDDKVEEIITRNFIEGAKWQQEISYSEEEVVSFIHKFLKEHQPQLPYLLGGINMWFGQFKKK